MTTRLGKAEDTVLPPFTCARFHISKIEQFLNIKEAGVIHLLGIGSCFELPSAGGGLRCQPLPLKLKMEVELWLTLIKCRFGSQRRLMIRRAGV